MRNFEEENPEEYAKLKEKRAFVCPLCGNTRRFEIRLTKKVTFNHLGDLTCIETEHSLFPLKVFCADCRVEAEVSEKTKLLLMQL